MEVNLYLDACNNLHLEKGDKHDIPKDLVLDYIAIIELYVAWQNRARPYLKTKGE